jgi:hypothetical protein
MQICVSFVWTSMPICSMAGLPCAASTADDPCGGALYVTHVERVASHRFIPTIRCGAEGTRGDLDEAALGEDSDEVLPGRHHIRERDRPAPTVADDVERAAGGGGRRHPMHDQTYPPGLDRECLDDGVRVLIREHVHLPRTKAGQGMCHTGHPPFANIE